MTNLTFLRYNLECSLKKLIRNRYTLLAELFQLGLAALLLIGLANFQLVDSTRFLYILVTLVMFFSIGAATKIGTQYMSQKNQGFLQELQSAPTSTTDKIIGLISSQFILVFLQTSILVIIVPFLASISLSVMQIISIYFVAIFTTFSSGFISVIVSSKTESQQMLSIIMVLLSLSQFSLNGLLLSVKDLSIVALNPYSYIADVFLHLSNVNSNYPIILDLAVTAVFLLVVHLTAVGIIDRVEV
jgi:ABC-type multidrug transport system permease subunit